MKVMYLPYASIIKLPSKGRNRKDIVSFDPEDHQISPKSICDWMNKELSLQVNFIISL